MLQWYHLKVSFADKCLKSFKSCVFVQFQFTVRNIIPIPIFDAKFQSQADWGDILCQDIWYHVGSIHIGVRGDWNPLQNNRRMDPPPIGLKDRQGQRLSPLIVGFPVPYLRVKLNLPVPPISGRPTSPRGASFRGLKNSLVIGFDGGRNPRKTT